MSNTSEIVNSVFDWRSVGGIIMSYIETSKEEYKQRFDLVVKEMNQTNNRAAINGLSGYHYYGSRERCDCVGYGPLCYKLIRQRINLKYGLKEARYDIVELHELAMLMYNRFCKLDSKSKFKKWYGNSPNALYPLYEHFFRDFVFDYEYDPVMLKLFVIRVNITAYSTLLHLFIDFVRGDRIWLTYDTVE